jgi:hypothetical protein
MDRSSTSTLLSLLQSPALGAVIGSGFVLVVTLNIDVLVLSLPALSYAVTW